MARGRTNGLTTQIRDCASAIRYWRKRKEAVLPYGASYNIDYFQKALRKHLERAKDEGIEIRPAVLAEAERALA